MFRRSADGVLTDADVERLQQCLLAEPMAGVVIAGTGGARKLRLGIRGRGTRGGVRVIYFYHARAARVYLLLVYPKNAAGDLSVAGRRAVKDLISAIEQEA